MNKAAYRRAKIAAMTPEERIAYNQYMRDHMRKKHESTPWYSSYCNRRSWSIRNGIEFSLTKEEMAAAWGSGCALTGEKSVRGVGHIHRGAATLDRIVPAQGYTTENAVLVRSDVNSAKGSGTYADLDYMVSVLLGECAVVETPFLELTPDKCGDLLKGAQKRSAKIGIGCEITRELLRDSYRASVGRCAVTGIPFRPMRASGCADFFSCSLDRINPSSGYTKDNSRLVIWGYNSLKGDDTDSAAIETAKKLRSFGVMRRLAESGL